MLRSHVGRAVRAAALIAAVAGPVVAVAEGTSGTTGSSGGTGSSSATGSTGSTGGTGSSASSADTGTSRMPSSPAALQKMKPSEMYNMMDKDKDGFVTKEEFLKFQERVFDSWDKNKTGRLGQAMFTDAG